jgi:hypothetical protein
MPSFNGSVHKRTRTSRIIEKADPGVAERDINTHIAHLTMNAWVKVVREGRILRLTIDEEARAEGAALDGCYVIKSDVPRDKADKETLHAGTKTLRSWSRTLGI